MNFGKLLELAYDGALWRWTYAKENHDHNPGKINKRVLDEKWADMNAVTELRAEYESNGKNPFSDEAKRLERIKSQAKQSGIKTESEHKYMVRVVPLDESVKPSMKFYSTLSEATDAYMNFKYQIKMNVLNANAFLYKKRDGHWYQLEVTTSAVQPEVERKQPQQSPQKSQMGYAIHVVHNSGKIQKLDFESPRAVKEVVEILKFYLKTELIDTVVVFKKITPAHYETIKIIRKEDV